MSNLCVSRPIAKTCNLHSCRPSGRKRLCERLGVRHENEVLNTVANFFDLDVSEIVSERRNRQLYDARKCAYLIFRSLGWSTTTTGARFGKDHSTIVAALKTATDADMELAADLASMATLPNNFELRRERYGTECNYVLRNPRTAEEVDLPSSIASELTEALTYCE